MNSFDKIIPTYFIDDEMKNIIKEIDSKINTIEITDKQKKKYLISKSKVRSIHSSLAIEANSLSLFDVESIFENKLVIGRKDEIQEVKNAIELYYNINNYDYKKESDLLKAHKLLMKYLNDDNGTYRNHGEAVKNKEGSAPSIKN